MTGPMDPDRLRRHLADITGDLPARQPDNTEIVRRGRHRQLRRVAIAGTTAAVLAFGGVATALTLGGGDDTHLRTPPVAGPTATPTPSAVPRPTHPAVSPPPKLPPMPAARGSAPGMFVSEANTRVVVRSSLTGAPQRFLTPYSPRHRADQAQLLATANARAVWFLRSRNNCESDLMSVPFEGGASSLVLRPEAGLMFRQFAAEPTGADVMYETGGCHVASHTPFRIEVRTLATGRTARIDLPDRVYTDGLALAGGRLAISINDLRGHDRFRLFVADVTSLSGSGNQLADLREVAPRADCVWLQPAWTPSADSLFAGEACPNARTRVIQLDPDTLQAVYAGPAVSDEPVNLAALSADEFGHIIASRDDGEGPIDFVTIDGMRTQVVPNGSCSTADPAPYPCAREASW